MSNAGSSQRILGCANFLRSRPRGARRSALHARRSRRAQSAALLPGYRALRLVLVDGAEGQAHLGALLPCMPLVRGAGAQLVKGGTMAENQDAMWKCAVRTCNWEGPKSKLKDFACPKCGSEDIFERDDGLWEQGREDQARAEQQRRTDEFNDTD